MNETALSQRFFSRLHRSCRRPSAVEVKRRIFVRRAKEKASGTQGIKMAENFENLNNILCDWAKDKVQKSLVEALNRYEKQGEER